MSSGSALGALWWAKVGAAGFTKRALATVTRAVSTCSRRSDRVLRGVAVTHALPHALLAPSTPGCLTPPHTTVSAPGLSASPVPGKGQAARTQLPPSRAPPTTPPSAHHTPNFPPPPLCPAHAGR